MKRFELLSLCKKATVVNFNRGINTGVVLSAKVRRGKFPRKNYGVKLRQKVIRTDSDDKGVDNEGYREDTFVMDHGPDEMELPKPYKLQPKHIQDQIDRKIARKKFFEPPPEPLTVTFNERECIRYLYKSDRVQWSIEALSEIFPATPRVIKKIIRSKRIITPSGARELDRTVEKNWDLLAQGKLEAEPHVLEHLKKFINRRKELLEKIKENFDLAQVVKIQRPEWNRGEFSGILSSYEKAVEQLSEDSKKLLQDGVSEVKNEKEEKSSLDAVHKKITDVVETHDLSDKDSFLFENLKNFYSKPTTLENLEDQIVKQANRKKKKLDVFDEAILENKLKGRDLDRSDNSEDFKDLKSYLKSFAKPESFKEKTEKYQDSDVQEINLKQKLSRYLPEMEIKKNETWEDRSYSLPDSRTQFATENEVGKLYHIIKEKVEKPESEIQKGGVEDTQEKPKIDFSDPERVRRENIYYDAQVKDIEDTSFWGNLKSSVEKAAVESEKRPIYVPVESNSGSGMREPKVPSADHYPERINIPKDKRGSGLTFKVKDCYYDDDGEFLYRVPGMIK